MQSQSAPTYQAVITSLVPRERIANAVALNSLQFNLSRAIGPVIAGLLLASAGPGWCFAANALSLRGRDPRAADDRAAAAPAARAARASAESLRAGLRHVARRAAAARGHAARRRRELPRLPAHHLPAGDRGRRAARPAPPATACCSPASGMGAIVGRAHHRAPRPRSGARAPDAARVRRLRRARGRRGALALAVAVDGAARRRRLHAHDRVLDAQLARPGAGARTRCAAGCCRSSASPSAAAGRWAAWSRASWCALPARPS